MGATPLSMPTTMRGKSVAGNTATGIDNARYAPTITSVRIVKMMGRENCAVQSSGAAPSVGCIVSCSIIPYLSSLGVVVFVFVFFALGRLHDNLGLILQAQAAGG